MNRYVSLYKVADPGRVYRSQNQRIKHFPRIIVVRRHTVPILKYCIIQILATGTIYSDNTMYLSTLGPTNLGHNKFGYHKYNFGYYDFSHKFRKSLVYNNFSHLFLTFRDHFPFHLFDISIFS